MSNVIVESTVEALKETDFSLPHMTATAISIYVTFNIHEMLAWTETLQVWEVPMKILLIAAVVETTCVFVTIIILIYVGYKIFINP